MSDTVEREYRFLIARAKREKNMALAAQLETALLDHQTKPKGRR